MCYICILAFQKLKADKATTKVVTKAKEKAKKLLEFVLLALPTDKSLELQALLYSHVQIEMKLESELHSFMDKLEAEPKPEPEPLTPHIN